MPLVNGKYISPEDAIAQGKCPETGIDLKGVNIADHISRTWPGYGNHELKGQEAARRMKMLRDYTKQHPEQHPKYDDNGNLLEEEPAAPAAEAAKPAEVK